MLRASYASCDARDEGTIKLVEGSFCDLPDGFKLECLELINIGR